MRSVKMFLAGKSHAVAVAGITALCRVAKGNDALRGCEWRVVTVVKG
ncbi:MAG: hypothetical protein ACT6RN_14180 [Agrobacterium sp.]